MLQSRKSTLHKNIFFYFTCICSADWILELFVWPNNAEWYERIGRGGHDCFHGSIAPPLMWNDCRKQTKAFHLRRAKCPLYYFFYLRRVFFCILSWRRAHKNWGKSGEKGCMYFRDWLKPIFPLFLPSLLCRLKFQTSTVIISKVMPMVLVVTQTRTLSNKGNIPFQPTCTLCVICDIPHTAAT
jgi:hypothetical protein